MSDVKICDQCGEQINENHYLALRMWRSGERYDETDFCDYVCLLEYAEKKDARVDSTMNKRSVDNEM